jgi:hypothetical protein
MDQNKFSIHLRATNEGHLEIETDPPTKPVKGPTSDAIDVVSDRMIIRDGLGLLDGLPGPSGSPSDINPRMLIHIPSIGVELELHAGWVGSTVNRYTDTPVTSQAEPPAEPPSN